MMRTSASLTVEYPAEAEVSKEKGNQAILLETDHMF